MFTVELKNRETDRILDVPMSTFETGQDCAVYASELNVCYVRASSPLRARVIPIKQESEIDWKQRERLKFNDGIYNLVPWHSARWYWDSPLSKEHFTHISKKNPGKIAYTQSPEKGIANIQTPMSPGRYLTKYFNDILSDNQIRDYATSMAVDSAETEIEFIFDSDEIGEAYRNGPSSCMGDKSDSFFDCNSQPTRVYGAGDLALAVIRNSENRVMSRTISWPDKKRYAGIYGDDCAWDEKLRNGLKGLDFERSGNFDGARILKIECNDSYVMPYFDIGSNVSDHGDHFKIDSCGDICAENVNGLSGDTYTCEVCNVGCDSEEYSYVEGYGIVCHDCASYCEHCEESCLSENMQSVDGGDKYVCDSCADCDFPSCESCDERFSSDSMFCTGDGDNLCESCLDNDHSCCEVCSEYYRDCTILEDTNETICADCLDSNDYFQCDDCSDWFESDSAHAYHAETCESCGDERLDSEPVLDLMLRARSESNLAQVSAFLKGYYHSVAYGATQNDLARFRYRPETETVR